MISLSVDHLVAFGPSPGRSALGRVYCYWLIAQELGWRFDYVSWEPGETWAPLASEAEFLNRIHQVPDVPHARDALERLSATGRSALLGVKNLPIHLDLLARCTVPGPKLIDIDDPQVETRLERMTTRHRWGIAKPSLRTRHVHPVQYRLARRRSARFRTIVSNPALATIYGGVVIPHVRMDPAVNIAAASRPDGTLRLCFVGTPRAHKGLELLRTAAGIIANDRAVELTVTDDVPRDAKPWERWVGVTTLEAGMDIAGSSTVSVFPSSADTWGRYQLPVKLIDAMMLGRPIIITPLAPLLWAAGPSAIVVPHDDPGAIANAVVGLADDPQRRGELGALARQRAISAFTPKAAAPFLREAVA